MWNHLQDAGPDEYGAARWNVALGRLAPLSGCSCNKFYACMGAAIRSELWACLAPVDPELAVRLAREDACTDHCADGLHEPETIGEFSDLVAATAAQVLEYYGSTMRLTGLPEKTLPAMHAPWTNDIHAADEMDCPHESLLAVTPLCARLLYPEEVSLAPKTEGVFRLALRNPCDQALRGRFTLSVPEGWLVGPKGFDFAFSPAQSEQFCFCVVPGEMAKRRARSNPIDFDFTLENGVRFSMTSDLPVTIPWLRTNLDTGKVEVVEAHAVFQAVPEGHYLYRTALKANVNMPVKLGAMSERALKVRMNGEEVLVTDGSFYVPAYHRGKTTVDLTTIKGHGGWNQVEIEVLPGVPGELFFSLARPHNCCEWLQGAEYSLAPLGER